MSFGPSRSARSGTTGTWIVIGSNAGKDRTPAWVDNLRARARGRCRSGRHVTVGHASAGRRQVHEAGPDEAAILWPIVIDAYPGYGIYRDRTDREVALFVLTPLEAA